jgi:hypothetical protein
MDHAMHKLGEALAAFVGGTLMMSIFGTVLALRLRGARSLSRACVMGLAAGVVVGIVMGVVALFA